MPTRRGYELRFVDVDRPASVSVTGPSDDSSWSYEETERVLRVSIDPHPIKQRIPVAFTKEPSR